MKNPFLRFLIAFGIMNVEINRRVFFKTATLGMLTIMAIAGLPVESQAQKTTKIYGKACFSGKPA